MRVPITGRAGFLGSALANHQARAGHHVRVPDDLSTGDKSCLHPQVFFKRGDVRDAPRLWTLLRYVECVHHLEAVTRHRLLPVASLFYLCRSHFSRSLR